MLKIESLRIGNLVLDEDGDVLPVISLNKQTVFHPNGIFSDIRTIKPIPITEEWLLKFGFGKNVMYFDLVYVELDEDGFYKLTDDNGDLVSTIEIKHVHQLQNLYFALTGEELQYKALD